MSIVINTPVSTFKVLHRRNFNEWGSRRASDVGITDSEQERNTVLAMIDYKEVAVVRGTLSEVFGLTQHTVGSWQDRDNVAAIGDAVRAARSTSIGDVVVDLETGAAYMVANSGYVQVTLVEGGAVRALRYMRPAFVKAAAHPSLSPLVARKMAEAGAEPAPFEFAGDEMVAAYRILSSMAPLRAARLGALDFDPSVKAYITSRKHQGSVQQFDEHDLAEALEALAAKDLAEEQKYRPTPTFEGIGYGVEEGEPADEVDPADDTDRMAQREHDAKLELNAEIMGGEWG